LYLLIYIFFIYYIKQIYNKNAIFQTSQEFGGGRRKRSNRRSYGTRIQRGGMTELLEKLPEKLNDSNYGFTREHFESILAQMNTEAKTNVSYDVMKRYVRLYNAHRSNETFSRGKYMMTTPRAPLIRNRMKQLVKENPGLVKLWNLPSNSNPFNTNVYVTIDAFMNDNIYKSNYITSS